MTTTPLPEKKNYETYEILAKNSDDLINITCNINYTNIDLG